jgi:hypothetical protein
MVWNVCVSCIAALAVIVLPLDEKRADEARRDRTVFNGPRLSTQRAWRTVNHAD